jgi:hypothetical protein
MQTGIEMSFTFSGGHKFNAELVDGFLLCLEQVDLFGEQRK